MRILAEGEIEIQGRMPWSSNGTFLVTCAAEGQEVPAVYKPHRGERPLWDFPDGLYRREVAAFELSEALGWGLVPTTIVRLDAPLGEGSLQLFVPADFTQHYFTLLEDPAHHDALRLIGAFDLVANNADRKGGHCLLGSDGRIWAIDNGLCFHTEPRLRTVIWDFSGQELPARAVADLATLDERPLDALAAVLHPDELEATLVRSRAVAQMGCFPAPHPEDRPYPWPLV